MAILQHEWTRSHRGGMWGADGRDPWAFDVPADRSFDSADLHIRHADPGCGARLDGVPPAGTRGHDEVVMRWWCAGYGRVEYRLRVFVNETAGSGEALRVFDSNVVAHGPYWPVGAAGVDDVAVQLGPGYNLDSSGLVIRQSRRAAASIRRSPPRRSAGRLQFEVGWSVQRVGGGRLEYLVRAFARENGPFFLVGGPVRLSPTPGRAGAPLTASITVGNQGSEDAQRCDLRLVFYAKQLDDVAQGLLDLVPDDQREYKASSGLLDVALPPGGPLTTLSFTETVPARRVIQRLLPQFPSGVSTAGNYRVSAEVRVQAADLTMIPAYSETIEDFRIDP